MTSLDQMFHKELDFQRQDRDRYRAKAWVANLLVEAFECRLGYSADCSQAMDMISEGSPTANGQAADE